jgi:multidrug efflux system outer membrane protein
MLTFLKQARELRSVTFIVCVAGILGGCKVGPNYARPTIPAPPQFRAAQPQTDTASLGDIKWFDLFQDEVLRQLIQQSLDSNYDVQMAAQRIIAAEGQFRATRSGLFPQFGAEAGASRVGLNSPIESTGGIYGTASWEIDLFGKLRRATEAARADLLSDEENRKAVIQTLVSQVAAAYFSLREYDAEIDYVQLSIQTRQESLRLVTSREAGGVASLVDVDQAKTLVQSAQADLSQLERDREQTENYINVLLGRPPGPVMRGRNLVDQNQPPQVPAGLPSALLERRPDLRAAEQRLIAANARVGVAKAAFFPSINLTATGGYQTTDLLGVINRSGFSYTMNGVVDLPIFDAGRRSGNYTTAKAVRDELVLDYQKTINDAFRDVSDALIGYQKNKETTATKTLLAGTLRDQSQLANQRYAGGVTSYLEVLDTERQRLTAERELAQSQRDVLTSLVQLYSALGGGWQ